MKKMFLWIPVLAIAKVSAVCGPIEKTVIDAEVKCFESGVNIDYMGDEGIKVACMQDQRVQSQCGADGRVTRLEAYRQWLAKLKQAENSCMVKGGDFSYSDPQFTEPTDESYCMQAQPEVGSNMFEGTVCNYRAICPTITVVCDLRCGSEPTKAAFDPSTTLYPSEDSGFLKRLVLR